MQTTPKANNILGHFFALLGAVVMLAIATWVTASTSEQVKPLDNLATPRTGHTATALSDGKILITGGRDADGNLVAASEIFDPETQTSSTSATLNTARVDHSATVLIDGRVLIVGGTGASGALSSAEIFDPAHPENGFTTVGSTMSTARTRHTATLLNDGHVLIAGGDAQGTAELFDSTTGTFSPQLWNLTVARSGHTATLFSDDSVLLAGGNTATMETYTPGSGFTLDPATMSVVRTGHWAFELSDTRLLLFQGDTGNTIDEFNPGTGAITPKGSLDFHASSSSLLANGKVLVLGTDVSGLYDPNAVPPAPDFNAFDETSVPNSGVLPRSGQAAVQLPGDKKILITGGVNANNQLLGQALFNPAKIWTDKDDYRPDEPVILSGSGWQANEPIYLFAVDNETEQWTYETTVPADANGEFVLSPYFIVELRHLGVQFHVTAVGQSTMQADVYFTDARNWNLTFAGTGTGTVTIAPSTGTINAPVSCGGTGTNAASQTVFSTCSPNISTSDNGAVITFTATATGGSTFGGWSAVANFSPTTCSGTTTPCTGVAAGSAAMTVTFNGAAATTTTVTSTPNPSTYGTSVSFTATVAKQTGTGTPTGSVTFYEGASCSGAALAGPVTLNGSGQASFSTSSLTVSGSPHTIRACYSPNPGFLSSDGTVSQTVNKANPTATLSVTNSPVTYNTSQQAATVSISASSVPGTVANVKYNGSSTVPTNAGTYAITADFVPNDAANYNTLTNQSAGSFVIQKANPTATLLVTNSPVIYNGSPQSAVVSISASSVPGSVANVKYNGSSTAPTNAATYAVTADFVPTDSTNYNTLTNQSASNFIIQKATPTATLLVTNSPKIYNGLPQAATVTVSTSSVPGTVVSVKYNGSSTVPTNAATYAITADFVPTDSTNYNTLTNQSAGSFVIQKANATVVVTPYTCPTTTYNGLTHTASYTINGVNGESGATVGTVDVSDTIHTHAGIYNGDQWSFMGTANYNDTNGTVDDCIGKADATVVVTPYTCPGTTYTGVAHTATYTVTGVNGETEATVGAVNVSGTTHTNAGTYNNDPWSFTGTSDYNDQSGTVNDCIAKAAATVVVTPYTCPSTTYTGLAHTASYTVTGVNGESGATVGTVDVSGTSHTNAGTYNNDPWSFTGTANYNDQSGTVDDCIAKATATVVVDPYTCPTTTYTGLSHTATVVSITGVNGETGATVGSVDVSNTTHTNAGTYAADYWFFTGTGNYNNIGNTTITDCIAKATATVVVDPYTCPTTTYTGLSHTATVVSITGVNGETGATVGSVDVSNTTHTNAGTYAADYWFFTGTGNYNNIGNTTITDCIAKATATVVVDPYTCPTTTYTGLSHTATVVSITGVNGETGATVGAVDVSNTTHTDAGTYAADYWFFTGTGNYNNIGNTTITDCIAKATATVVVDPYTCPTTTYTGLSHTATVVSITGVNGETGATVGSVDVSNTTHTNAGTYAADYWFFTGTGNYNNIGNTTITDCIAKADATVVVTAYNVTFDSNPHTATYTINGVNGESGATVGTINVSGTSHTDAGTYNNDPWVFTGGANYNDQSGTIDDFIGKADATVVVTAYSVTFDANPHTATYTIIGVGTDTTAAGSSINVTGTTHTNAGTYNGDPWSFNGGTNYNNQNGTVDDAIAKANATVVVTAYSVTFDANPHTATYTVTGVGTDTAAAGSSVDVSATTHTNAATYNGDVWSFNGGANYNNQNGTVDDLIGKANATVVVTAYSVTFDANPHTATYTVTGVGTDTAAAGSSINVTGTTHTGAGTYNGDAWSFNGGANYNNQSGTVDDFIGKANATVVVTAYSVTFDANPHTATYTITGVGTDTAAAGSSINVTGTIHTGAGTYNGDPWSFNGGANYNNQSGTVDDFIGKANATVVVTAYSVTFDANPHTATYTVTGAGTDTAAAGSSIDVSGTTHTGAGTYNGDPWSFNGGANYNNQSGTVDDFIGKADATVVVTAYSVTFDTNPHTATYTVTGVGTDTAAAGSSIDVSGTTHTGAGTYNGDPWSFNGGANYNNQNGTVDDLIGKADATVVVTAYSVTFDANPHTATYTVTGVGTDTAAAGSSIDVSATTHTNGGTYNGDVWSFNGGANYNNQSGTVDDFIGKANATVAVTAYSVTFDANPHTATYTVTGVGTDTAAAGSSINVSGTTHTGAGTYNGDAWSFNGGTNYNNQSGTVDDFIGKANATVVVTAYNVTFDANPHTATYAITGVGTDTAAAGSSINVTGTTHTGAGTYNGDAWSFNGGANYNNQSGTVDDFIGKANATVVVTAYSVTFDANPHTATYTVTGVGTDTAAAGSSINVTGTTHTNAGTYTGDPWSFNGGANYNNQNGTVNDAIAKANAVVVVTAYNVTYNGMPRTATYTITGVGTDTGAAGSSINVTGTTHTNAGTYTGDPWSFNGGTNYNNQNGTVNDVIAKANATFTVMLYNVSFDNNPHTATVGTITGVNGETGPTVGTINLSGTTHTLPGDYPSDPWTFTGTANYNNRNGTVHDVIHYGTTCTGSDPGGVILPPINSDGTSVYKRKAGSTIPVKFKVCDANGNSISNPYAVFLNYPQGGQLTMTGNIRGTVENINETGETTIPDVAFTFTGGQWHFNMDTGNLEAGHTYTFRINLAFGPGITFVVGTK